MEPPIIIGIILNKIAHILGVLIVTWALRSIINGTIREKLSFPKSAIVSFISVGIFTLFVSSYTYGFVEWFIFYIPCLVFWLVMDIRRARKLKRGEIVEEKGPNYPLETLSDYPLSDKGVIEKRPLETTKEKGIGRKIMKLLSILLNVALILSILLLMTKRGMPSPAKEGFETFVVLLCFVTPLINMLYIFIWSGESWFALYFKRKAMEEKKKIEKLSSKE